MNSFQYLWNLKFTRGCLVGCCIGTSIGILVYSTYEFGTQPSGVAISNEWLGGITAIGCSIILGFLIGGLNCIETHGDW